MTSCFVDSNIWLYGLTQSEPEKMILAQSLIKEKANQIVISTQVINEVCVNLLRKARFQQEKIRELVLGFYEKYFVSEINKAALLKAADLRESHNFSFWDSLIVASALNSRAEKLYSEDMQDGLILENRLVIVNPFR